MQRNRFPLVALAALSVTCGGATPGQDVLAGASASPLPAGAPTPVSYASAAGPTTVLAFPGQVLVTANPGRFAASQAALRNAGGSIAGQLPAALTTMATVAPAGVAAFIAAVSADSSVAAAVPNMILTAACSATVPPKAVLASSPTPTPIAWLPGSSLAVVDLFSSGTSSGAVCPSHGGATWWLASLGTGNVAEVVTLVNVENGTSGTVDLYNAVFAVARLIQGAVAEGHPAIINVSLESAASTQTVESQTGFLYLLYQMVDILSAETRSRVSIFVAAGNSGLDLTQALAALRAQFPDAAKCITVAGGLNASQGAVDTTLNHASDPQAMIYAPANNVTAYVDGQQIPGLRGTSYAAPLLAHLEAQLASDPKYAGLTLPQLNAAIFNAGPLLGPARTLPTLAQAQAEADLLLPVGSGLDGGTLGGPSDGDYAFTGTPGNFTLTFLNGQLQPPHNGYCSGTVSTSSMNLLARNGCGTCFAVAGSGSLNGSGKYVFHVTGSDGTGCSSVPEDMTATQQ